MLVEFLNESEERMFISAKVNSEIVQPSVNICDV